MINKISLCIFSFFVFALLNSCNNPAIEPKISIDQQKEKIVTIGNISGVLPPITGAMPARTIAENEQYSGIVSWKPTVSDFFISNTSYSATITLTPKEGYTFSGVTEDFFTVSGSTNNTTQSGSSTVTVTFPVTIANLAIVSDVHSTEVGTLKAVQGGTFNNGIANMTVSSFRMSQYEVTGEQYAAIMEVEDPSIFTSVTKNPVENVTWYDAVEFCNRLSLKEKLTPVYEIINRIPSTSNPITAAQVYSDWTANGYRLPTEAEWNYAAKGGRKSSGYTYSGSNTVGVVAWYNLNSVSTTHPVGEKIPNELGFNDMSGNVFEWCWDFYSNYPLTSEVDYRGPSTGSDRVRRGGSWASHESLQTIEYRVNREPGSRVNFLGFRVVRS